MAEDQKDNQSFATVLTALNDPSLSVRGIAIHCLVERMGRSYLPREEFLGARQPLEAMLQNGNFDSDYIGKILAKLPSS